MKVSGSMTNNMATVLKAGLMVHAMKVTISKAKKTARDGSHSQMEATMKETSSRIRSTVLGSTGGQTAKYTQVIGEITKWKAQVCLFGETAKNTKVNLWLTNAKVEVTSRGLTAVST
jgi:hypothetical protein